MSNQEDNQEKELNEEIKEEILDDSYFFNEDDEIESGIQIY